ncbi:MAG: carbonic anhydrase [Bacteroidia bacterium]|nr:carbonic anhydrase [Bacteroidia bacterium]
MKKTFLLFCAAVAMCACQQTANNNVNVATEALESTMTEVSTPAEALARLEAGNARYVADSLLFPHHDHKRLVAVAPHQAPFAAVVTCSDSRVPAEMIFDQGIGDIFVIRTAGNSVNDDVVMGSVDYALEHLGVKILVVMGHESCGGVTGAITEEGEADEHSKIDELLGIIRQDVKEYVGKPELLDEAIRCNTAAQVNRIVERENVKELVEAGKTMVIGAYYNVHDGSVSFSK